MHRASRSIVAVAAVATALASAASPAAADVDADFLSDPAAGISLEHSQQWGDFGFDTAAAAPAARARRCGSARQTYEQGLGHHANGEIVDRSARPVHPLSRLGRRPVARAASGAAWSSASRSTAK